MSHFLSIILPTRNEQENISPLIDAIWKAKIPMQYEMLVVDDSDDNLTAAKAMLCGARVIRGQHKGLGQAIVDGIKQAQGDMVLVMDADLSHPPQVIPKMVEALNDGYNMAVGSRYVNGGQIDGWTTKRKIISRVASGIAYPITGLRDNTSGYFACLSSLLDGVNLKPDSWKIMLEVLVKTRAKAVEIPIVFKDRQAGKSKFTTKEVFTYLKHLFKLAMFKWRMLNFMLVGGLGFVVNMAVYYPLSLWFQSEVTFLGQHFYLPPFLLSSLGAITSNYYWNKKWTFGDMKAEKLSYLRYLSMASATLLLDMVALWMLVDFGKLSPVVAAALAIIFVFILRYFISKRWIWTRK